MRVITSLALCGSLILFACTAGSSGGSPGDVGPDGPAPVDTDGSESDGDAGDVPATEIVPKDGKSPGTDGAETSPGEVAPEVTQPACEPGPGRASASTPEAPHFVDISEASGIRKNNVIHGSPIAVPINDHSRLGFVDLDGDGDDDIVTHSIFLNPQAGIPFEHLIFMNQGDGTFTDHSDASGLRDVQAGAFAFADVDNDGDQDCFASLDVQGLPGQTNQMLMNDGSGVFTPKANSGVETVAAIAANAVFADFDGDGRVDLFVGLGHTSYAGPDQLLLGQGDGTFINESGRLAGAPAKPTNGSVVCDYDGDGDSDILVSTYGVSHEAGHNVLWENDGQGYFTNVAEEVGFAYQITGNYYLASTGYGLSPETTPGGFGPVGSNGFGLDCDDIDGDGDLDVWLSTISHPVDSDYNRKWSDPTQLLLGEVAVGGTVFVNRTLERGLPFNEGDVDAAIVDFDLDGRPDLSLSRDKKYEKAYEGLDQKAWFGLMHQRVDGDFESVGPESGINDLDGDHTASLTPCTSTADCAVAGETCLFEKCRWMCATDADCPAAHEICHATKSVCKPLLAMKNTQNHAWSDIDGDGDLDLLAGGRDTGGGRPNFLFRNEIGQANPWLKLRLVGDGVAVHRDAIGTRVVTTFEDGTKRTQWVKASRGMHTSMDTRWIHVGLGDRGCAPQVSIRWPDGTQAHFEAGGIAPNKAQTIIYPDQLAP